MRNLKKLLAVIVTIAMIATFAIPAFATTIAPAASVADADTKAAVERLSALGIVNGMPDGKFHEEMELTREDFTKMLVVALNLNNAATAAKGTTKFADVAATRWSSGYVNVGVSKGIIKGYDNGNFGPGDKLTEAQAISMLVRALGYKDEWLEGSWPENMVNKADELGILDDVTFSGGVATRGIAAILLNNTLTKNLVTQTGFGDDATWQVSGDTILGSKLGVEEISGTVVSVPAVNDELDADAITVVVDEEDDDYTVLQEGVNLDGLLGMDVTMLVDGTDVKYITIDTDADNTVVGTIVGIDDDTVTIKGADGEDEDYTFAAEFYFYANNADLNAAAFAGIIDDPAGPALPAILDYYGTFIVNDDDEIIFANAYDFDVQGLVVTEINADKQYVKGVAGAATIKVELDATDGLKVFKDGAVAAFSDIKDNDLLYTVDVPYGEDTYTYAFIVTNSVTGELKKVKIGELTIDATAYTVSDDANNASDMAFSLDSGDSSTMFAAVSDLNDAMSEEVTAYLDIKGEVRYLVAGVEETSDTLYGIVARDGFLVSGDDAVKIYTKDDKDVTYLIEDDSDDFDGGEIVSYSVNSDGGIDEGDITVLASEVDVAGDDVADASVAVKEIDSFDSDDDMIVAEDGSEYFVTDDTVIMSYYNADEDAYEPAVVTWDDIKDKNPADGLMAYIVADADEASFVVFTKDYTLSSDGFSAYVTGEAYGAADGVMIDVVLSDGTEKSYVLVTDDEPDEVDVTEGDFIVFETNADGEITTVVRAVYDDVVQDPSAVGLYSEIHGTVFSFSSNVLKVNRTGDDDFDVGFDKSYKLTDETTIYKLTLEDGAFDSAELGDLSDIEEDGNVVVILNDGAVEMVIIVD